MPPEQAMLLGPSPIALHDAEVVAVFEKHAHDGLDRYGLVHTAGDASVLSPGKRLRRNPGPSWQ